MKWLDAISKKSTYILNTLKGTKLHERMKVLLVVDFFFFANLLAP
jgi:hypothetical protein